MKNTMYSYCFLLECYCKCVIKRCLVIFVVILWLIFVSSPVIRRYKFHRYEVLRQLREKLDQKSKELASLKLQNENLMNFEKFGFKSLKYKMTPGLTPNMKYKSIRHRIFSNTKDLWLYIENNLIDMARNGIDLAKIETFLEELTKRKRCLLQDHKNLAAEDGHAEFRKLESRRLSDLVQRRLWRLQNPTDCEQAKKLVCDLNKNGGFGCQMHHLVHCLSFGYATNRTVVLNSTGWRYNPFGWESYFHPISNCTMNSIVRDVENWTESSNAEVMLIPEIEVINPKPEFILPALPQDVFHRIVLFNGNPLGWWVGQMVKYFLRPLDELQKVVNQTVSKLNLNSPIVGIHIRRTDKINAAEAVYHELDEYMIHVEEYFNQTELTRAVPERRVYIATDDINVLDELRQLRGKYKQYTFIYERSIIENAAVGRRYSRQALEGLLIDLAVLPACNFVVCTFSSNLGRLVFELMQTNRVDASYSAASLDDVYYLSNMYAQDRIAVMDNVGKNDDLSMELGDQIGLIPGGHRDGYDLGTNKRTMDTGLIPWYKTTEDLAVYPAPKYDDQI